MDNLFLDLCDLLVNDDVGDCVGKSTHHQDHEENAENGFAVGISHTIYRRDMFIRLDDELL